MLTNLSKEQADVTQLAAIYRARWAVEIQFRAWKQSLNLGKALNRKSNEHHLQALVLAGMIAHQLGMKIAQRIVSTVSRERLSYEKLYDLLAVRLIKARDLAELIEFDPDPRHVTRDQRTRKSPVESGILALT
jgi:Transposase DDE domain